MKISTLFNLGHKKQHRAQDGVPEFITIIGAGSRYTGSVNGVGNYLVYGYVVGDCDLDGTLVLRAGARWVGNIVARHVVIAGEVVGHVVAHAKLELHESARVSGDLTSPIITIAEGGIYEGEICMDKNTVLHRFNKRRDL